MPKVEITYEKTMRVCKEIEATEEQIESLINGDNPFSEELENILGEGDVEYDYTVHDEHGNCLVDWK